MSNLQQFPEEIWKDIPSYEGLYQVSTLGRVKSLGMTRSNYKAKPIIKKLRSDSLDRYVLVDLNKFKIKKTCLVHRLSGKAFLGLTDDKEINHDNGDTKDNRLVNLIVSTHSENEKHKYHTLNQTPYLKGRYGNKSISFRRIIQKTIGSGEIIETFDGALEVYRKLGLDQSTIHKCCKGKNKSCGGYVWEYEKNKSS